MHLRDRVHRIVLAHDLARPATRVLAAVSGGSDSVALVCLLAELGAAGHLQLAGIAHFNHQLRPDADEDESFCRALASRLGQPFTSSREDVRARAAASRCSIEDAARQARYQFLEAARQSVGADAVALGHTRDDQAETFLLRLLRGAGARGLAAMHPRRDRMIRPLLFCRRAELSAYLTERGVSFRHDESNDDVAIPRNRIRAELLPLLEQRFNPSVVDVLADEAEIARGEWAWLEQQVTALAGRAVRERAGVRRVSASATVDAPIAVVRHLLARVLADGASGRAVSFAHVEAARHLLHIGGQACDGPGQRMERIGDALVLTSRERQGGRPARRDDSAEANFFRFPLSIPGEVVSPDGWTISADRAAPLQPIGAAACSGTRVSESSRHAQTVAVRLDSIREPLFVRNRRHGDRFSPPGLAGHKKLQDFFVDRKVARHQRDRVPIVVDADDRIVWVAGHAANQEFAVTDPAQAVLILRLKQLGGGA